jgi:hypothetical protein
MTTKPVTPAGRGAATAAGAARADAGHRRTLRQQPAPRTPRRVSGPARERTGAAAHRDPATDRAPRTARAGGTARAARAARATGASRAAVQSPGFALPWPHFAPRLRPRRRSGPVRTVDRSLPRSTRALAFVRGLPDHRMLDRLVRGRAWIPVLGLMLTGIVAMQVEVLKLGAGVGRSIEQGTALQSRNELLQSYVSSLSDARRIERMAAKMGMVMAAPTSLAFLGAQSGDAGRAAAAIHEPDATSFLWTLQANAQEAAIESGSVTQNTPSGTAPSSAASSTTETSPSTETGGTASTVTSDGGGTATGATATGATGTTTPGATSAATGTSATTGPPDTGGGTTAASTGGAGSTAGSGTTASGTAGSGTSGATGTAGTPVGTAPPANQTGGATPVGG